MATSSFSKRFVITDRDAIATLEKQLAVTPAAKKTITKERDLKNESRRGATLLIHSLSR